MELWKKNFLFVFSLLEIILFAFLFLFLTTDFYQELKQEQQNLQLTTENLDSYLVDQDSSILHVLQQVHQSQELYFKVTRQDGTVKISSLPSVTQHQLDSSSGVLSAGSFHYLFLEKQGTSNDGTVKITYVQDISRVYKSFHQQILLAVASGLGLSVAVGALLYWQLKKLYRPIQNLSHELRTPLTLISGYSELLLRTKQSEENQLKMAQNILDESRSLQKTIEELLIMGDLKGQEPKKTALRLSDLVNALQPNYPMVMLKVENEEMVQGNEVLLNRLLVNLLDNAIRDNNSAELLISQKKLIIKNPAKEPLAASTLKKMNKGRKLAPHEYQGTGQGFLIAREIVLLHGGTLTIENKAGFVEVTAAF
ncbi:sensor histidine kinase [Enterococcus sp. AZ163]|uniref:sensor histidine kinase n=1 Tax=Enterococcus sp. AZ163 TaxID=2774638 RepID=UPI003D27936F